VFDEELDSRAILLVGLDAEKTMEGTGTVLEFADTG
jgi:hypothetical protein